MRLAEVPSSLRSPDPLISALFVLGIALLSYNFNAFGSADARVLATFQSDSDQLVYDALGTQARTLGRMGTTFERYVSQYGAQLDFYRALGLAGADPRTLQFLNASLLSLVAAALSFLVARRMFAGWGAIGFGLVLALSPMLVMFSRSPYWVAWTWFLPLLAVLLLGTRVFSARGMAALFMASFVLLLFRFLCGYEYASTIVLAAAAPIVYLGASRGLKLRAIALPVLTLGAASIFAMLIAFVLHAGKMGSTWSEGFDLIRLVAEKRSSQNGSADRLENACRKENAPDQQLCVANLQRSLEAPLPLVVAAYLSFRRTVPWLGGRDVLDNPDLEDARRAFRRIDLPGGLKQLNSAGLGSWMSILSLPASALLVWSAIAWGMVSIWRQWPRTRPHALLLLVSACAPLSWFVLMKGHSYAHMHLNFVLWCVPFLPMLAAYLLSDGRAARCRTSS